MTSLWRFNDVTRLVFDVMMAFDDVRLRFFVFVRCECDCLRYSQINAGILALIHVQLWKKCVCISSR